MTVTTWTSDGWACAEVTDTGCGVAPAELDRIFEPFFTTKGPSRGTGLGPPITRRIVDQLGGTLRVESELGVGSRFLIRFPVPTSDDAPSAD